MLVEFPEITLVAGDEYVEGEVVPCLINIDLIQEVSSYAKDRTVIRLGRGTNCHVGLPYADVVKRIRDAQPRKTPTFIRLKGFDTPPALVPTDEIRFVSPVTDDAEARAIVHLKHGNSSLLTPLTVEEIAELLGI